MKMNPNEVDNIIKMPNNTFCEEVCCICEEWFDACLTHIYHVIKNGKFIGYACHKCEKEYQKVKVTFT